MDYGRRRRSNGGPKSDFRGRRSHQKTQLKPIGPTEPDFHDGYRRTYDMLETRNDQYSTLWTLISRHKPSALAKPTLWADFRDPNELIYLKKSPNSTFIFLTHFWEWTGSIFLAFSLFSLSLSHSTQKPFLVNMVVSLFSIGTKIGFFLTASFDYCAFPKIFHGEAVNFSFLNFVYLQYWPY